MNKTVVGNKVNTYTMYATTLNPPEPVQYVMMGYDSLLGSHYDKYVIDYTMFSTEDFQPDVFDVPKGNSILFLLNSNEHGAVVKT